MQGLEVGLLLWLFLLSLRFTAPALIVLAVANHNALIPFGFAALYLLYPVYVVVIISLLSLLLVRFIPVGRGREVLTLFGVVLALGINLLNFLLNPAVRDSGFTRRSQAPSLPDIPVASAPWLPSGWAGRSADAILSGNWLSAIGWILPLLAASAAIFVVGTIISGRLYLAGWIQAVPPRRRQAGSARGRRLKGALPLIHPVLAAIVVKDWRMRTRDLAQLVRFAMPVAFLFIIFGLRFPRLLGSIRSLGEGPAAALLTAAVVARLAGTAEIFIRPGWLWAATAVLLAIAQAATLTILMVGIGAVFARFDWTDARRMLHPAAAFIGMTSFGIVTGASALVLGISLALASATGFPEFTTWLAAVTASVGGGIAVAALGVLVGNERLRSLEFG